MAKFDDYTQKNTPEDNDITLILDKTANVNKKTPFSGIWNWIVNKMTNAVIQNLQTTNKTVIGSINELNSNSYLLQGGTLIPENANLEDYKNPGNYYCNSSEIAATIQNIPPSSVFTGVAFTLKVELGAGTGNPIQTYREYRNGNIALRTLISGEWTDWKYILVSS